MRRRNHTKGDSAGAGIEAYFQVMHYPRAGVWWQRLTRSRRRGCGVCGLQWPCDEAKRVRFRTRAEPADTTCAWAGPTAVYTQVGRAGSLTPLQTQRAHGGWW